jgi:hypothetical protein
MTLMGINWIIYSSATWYSSGQTLWASASILAALGFTQSYRFSAGAWKLAASAICCYLAGGFWTVGHIAGPVAAVDLWAEGSKRCRRAAVIPLLASMASVALALTLGGSDINGRISFHGRTSRQALNVPMGVSHTLQSIPETLVCGNLGLLAPTTPMQGAILTAGLFALWLWSIKRNAPTPLELAGLAIVMSSYLFEWSYRGYLPFTSLRKVVPWYDTIPQVGFVLFLGGFIARGRNHRGSIGPLSRGGVIALTVLVCALYFVHRPRVDELFLERVPEMDENEAAFYLIPELHQLRGRALWEEFANWQRLHLAKLDQTELAARRLGIGLEQMRDAFDRLPAPECPEVYDAIDLLDLPASGKSIEPAVVRALLGPLVRMEPEPRLPPPQEIIPAVTEGLRNERSP